MASLMSKNFEELYDIMENILTYEELEKYMESVIKMNMENFVLHEWEKEKFDKMIEENIKKDAQEQGFKQGMKEGLEEGKILGINEGKTLGINEGKMLGIEENTIEMIKAMLNKKMKYELISEVSGKSAQEIKEIEKSALHE